MRALVIALALGVVTIALADTTKTPPSAAVQFGHKSHAQIGCAKCHDPGKPRRGKTHDRCTSCHGEKPDKTFPISDCAKCHPAGNDRPKLVRSQIAVTSAFSHAKHAGRAKQCIACHAAIAATDALELPSPKKLEACTTCHDGKAAFGVLTKCMKCHVDVPKGEFEVARPDKAFSHAKHDAVVTQPCSGCHRLSKTGEIETGGHVACVFGCHKHEAEFGLRKPTICGACHDGTEPWRPLIADKLPADTTEFGTNIDHRKHAGTCVSCHTLTTPRTELRPTRGHRACATAGCHTMTKGPEPQMASCEACHQRGVIAAREAARLSARWSVRATFNHRVHATKVAADCARCHTDVSSPTTLSIAAPPKAACAEVGCHDGSGAFKVTGTSCTRCHPGAPK